MNGMTASSTPASAGDQFAALEPFLRRALGPPGTKLTKKRVARFIAEDLPRYRAKLEAEEAALDARRQALDARRHKLLLDGQDLLIHQARHNGDHSLLTELEHQRVALEPGPPRTEAEWERAEGQQHEYAVAFGWEGGAVEPSATVTSAAVAVAVQRGRGEARPARRGTSSRSSSSSGDDDSSEPEPPPAGRLCKCGCGADISHRAAQARYLNAQHAANARQRRRRPRPDPYLNLPPHELATLRARVDAGCRCNGHHIPDGEGSCIKDGHQRRKEGQDDHRSLVRAQSAETRRERET